MCAMSHVQVTFSYVHHIKSCPSTDRPKTAMIFDEKNFYKYTPEKNTKKKTAGITGM